MMMRVIGQSHRESSYQSSSTPVCSWGVFLWLGIIGGSIGNLGLTNVGSLFVGIRVGWEVAIGSWQVG